MRKIATAILTALSCLGASAQQKAYICDGFRSTCVEVTSQDDITFSEHQKHIYIGGKEFDIADIDSITFTEPQFKEVTVRFNGNSAEVTIPACIKGVSASVSGLTNVSLTSTNTTDEILYTVSGNCPNGSLTINGEYKLTVALNGLDLTSTSAKAPINILCGKRIGVILKEGTVNTITDSPANTARGAFYTDGHAEFEGGGTINIKGNAKHALCANEYLQFKKSTGTINILGAVSDGIHCGKGKVNDDNSHFTMSGGHVTVNNAGSDCIDCDDYGCAFIKGGTLTLNVSQDEGTGLKADSCLYMTGGDITINITGNVSDGLRSCYASTFDGGTLKETVAGKGARGIRAKKTTKSTDTVLNGGYIYWNGTEADIIVSGSKNTADATVCYGIKADTEFKQTGGTIDITMSATDSSTKAYNFKTDTSTGGVINVK